MARAHVRVLERDAAAHLVEEAGVLAHWPRERYLELAPKYWAQTRARLDPAELAAEIGPLNVPPPLTATSEEQPSAE